MRLVAGMALCAWLLAVPAAAQEPRWEVEAYGGLVAAQAASGGTRSLPPAGPPIVTSSPIFPSRAVPSWLFGDGASLLNAVNAEFDLAAQVTPLDAAFAPLDAPRTANFGARLRRRLSPRWDLEIGFDTTASASVDTDALAAAVETTRASFRDAMAQLLATGPFSSAAIDATGGAAAASRRETALTLALNRRFGRGGGFVPYVTFGGGVGIGSGSAPTASLDAHYSFVLLGQIGFGERDQVQVRYDNGTAFLVVAGGGVQHDFSPRWGLRLDARVLIGPDTTRVLLDAALGSAGGHRRNRARLRRVVHQSVDPVQQRSRIGPRLVAQRRAVERLRSVQRRHAGPYADHRRRHSTLLKTCDAPAAHTASRLLHDPPWHGHHRCMAVIAAPGATGDQEEREILLIAPLPPQLLLIHTPQSSKCADSKP